MLLTVDIGNTNIVVGGFVGGELKTLSRLSTNAKKTEDEYAVLIRSILKLEGENRENVRGAIISSVVPPLTHTMKKALKKAFDITPMVVGPGVKSGVNLLVDNPAQVGADLVCTAAAVQQHYNLPALVVDMGTATKISYLDEKGAFCGVSIIPGVQIGIDALSRGTAQLPQISLDAPPSVIGRNTVESMQSGVVYGNASLIDGMLKRMMQELGKDLPVVATGGLAQFIIPLCETEVIIDDHLLLKGLASIYEKNN